MDRQQLHLVSRSSDNDEGLRILAQIIARSILKDDSRAASSDDSASTCASQKALRDSDTLIGASAAALSFLGSKEV